MLKAEPTPKCLFPLNVSEGLIASDAKQLAHIVVRATDRQLADAQKRKEIQDQDDFIISSDGLNFARMIWRCVEHLNVISVDGIEKEISEEICAIRHYSAEEFELAKIATRERVRIPFGMQPLDYALQRALRNPIELMEPALQKFEWPALLTAIAIQLKGLQKEKPFLLPIDRLRELLRLRKIVVAGAVKQLIQYRIIQEVGQKYHTNRAREFNLIAVEGQDWIWATSTRIVHP